MFHFSFHLPFRKNVQKLTAKLEALAHEAETIIEQRKARIEKNHEIVRILLDDNFDHNAEISAAAEVVKSIKGTNG